MSKLNSPLNHGIALLSLLASIAYFGGASLSKGAIVGPQVPEGARQIVLQSLKGALQTSPGFLQGATIGQLVILDAQRSYYISLDDLSSGRLLAGARAGEWRFPISREGRAAGVVLVGVDRNAEKTLSFESFEQSGFSSEMMEGLRKAGDLPQIKERNYEFRFLNIPAVHFVALWLHANADDIIIPLSSLRAGIDLYQPYSERQILALLKAAAEELSGKPAIGSSN